MPELTYAQFEQLTSEKRTLHHQPSDSRLEFTFSLAFNGQQMTWIYVDLPDEHFPDKVHNPVLSGWKLHLSVSSQDMERAWPIVYTAVQNRPLCRFKFVCPERRDDLTIAQYGKQFVFFHQQAGYDYQGLIDEISAEFIRAGIVPDCVPFSDKPVAGSVYFSYRNDYNPETGRYLSARDAIILASGIPYNPFHFEEIFANLTDNSCQRYWELAQSAGMDLSLEGLRKSVGELVENQIELASRVLNGSDRIAVLRRRGRVDAIKRLEKSLDTLRHKYRRNAGLIETSRIMVLLYDSGWVDPHTDITVREWHEDDIQHFHRVMSLLSVARKPADAVLVCRTQARLPDSRAGLRFLRGQCDTFKQFVHLLCQLYSFASSSSVDGSSVDFDSETSSLVGEGEVVVISESATSRVTGEVTPTADSEVSRSEGEAAPTADSEASRSEGEAAPTVDSEVSGADHPGPTLSGSHEVEPLHTDSLSGQSGSGDVAPLVRSSDLVVIGEGRPAHSGGGFAGSGGVDDALGTESLMLTSDPEALVSTAQRSSGSDTAAVEGVSAGAPVQSCPTLQTIALTAGLYLLLEMANQNLNPYEVYDKRAAQPGTYFYYFATPESALRDILRFCQFLKQNFPVDRDRPDDYELQLADMLEQLMQGCMGHIENGEELDDEVIEVAANDDVDDADDVGIAEAEGSLEAQASGASGMSTTVIAAALGTSSPQGGEVDPSAVGSIPDEGFLSDPEVEADDIADLGLSEFYALLAMDRTKEHDDDLSDDSDGDFEPGSTGYRL